MAGELGSLVGIFGLGIRFRGQKKDYGGRKCCKHINCWDWNDEEDNYRERTHKWKNEVLRFCSMLRAGGYS